MKMINEPKKIFRMFVRVPIRFIGLVTFYVLTLAPVSLVADDDARRVAQAVQVNEPPLIDGVVDEDIWLVAPALTDFIQAEPNEGEPATEKTVVRLLYDSQNIYVGVICYDRDPSGIVVTDSRRDSSLADMDSFQVIFDTFQDRQNGFVFGTNPAGIEYDAQVSREGEGGQTSSNRSQAGNVSGFNLNWDASWIIRTSQDEAGWMAEFSIPLRTLRYSPSKPQNWGINFKRNIRRKREEVYWSPISRIYTFFRLSAAGDLNGLELGTPRNFKVMPYMLSSVHRDYTQSSEGAVKKFDFGMDVKFGITPSLNLDVTVNTDFAHVEVDDQQINLTRFNLYFPEKRPFFLENSGTFSMGTADYYGSTLELFFSRRIGIGSAGELIPIRAGARLSGKAGPYNVGFMNMQTQGLDSTNPANNFSVAALRRDLPNRSGLGVVFVNRSAVGDFADPGDWNRTWGVSGNLGIGDALSFRGFAARTETPNTTGREHAVDVYGEFRKLWGLWWVEYTEVGDGFNPEAGFLIRDDYRTIQSSFIRNFRFPSISWLREVRPHVTYRHFWDFDGFSETDYIHLDSHVDFENGTFFSPAVNVRKEGLKESFEIAPGIMIPQGDHRFTELAWRWNTDQSASIGYEGSLDAGEFFTGKRVSLASTVRIRRGAKFNSAITWSYNDVNLHEGSFITNLAQFRMNYSFTPLVNLQSLLQYNDQQDVWSTNIRFGWLNKAGTGLFLVYNDMQGLGNLLIGPQNRSFVVKYNRQFDVLR